jgi:hypothetical protein
MILSDVMRECLETADVHSARELWRKAAPHLPQPKDDDEALRTIHYARTCSDAISTPARCYSHCWLTERGLPSGLPDRLKKRAERIYPRIVSAVGVAVRMRNPEEAPAGLEIRKAMVNAVLEAEADGRLTDSQHVRRRIAEARLKERKALFGR